MRTTCWAPAMTHCAMIRTTIAAAQYQTLKRVRLFTMSLRPAGPAYAGHRQPGGLAIGRGMEYGGARRRGRDDNPGFPQRIPLNMRGCLDGFKHMSFLAVRQQ